MFVIKITGKHDGSPSPYIGQFVQSYDPKLDQLLTTTSLKDARKFDSHVAAWGFCRQSGGPQSNRPDAMPSRPLTAYVVEIAEERAFR